jgi:cytochrome b561
MKTSANRVDARYTTTAKMLHWLIVLLLIIQYTIAWNLPHIGRDTVPNTIINLHFSFGASILFVMIVRAMWNLIAPQPTPLAGLPPWQIITARIVHYALYALLAIIPVLGWLNASFRGFDVSLFGLVSLPKLIETRAAGWAWTGDVHTFISYYVLLPLVGLHTVSALYHELIRRDGVLRRMLPERFIYR